MSHASEDVERALIALNDALCTWERTTGINSALVLRQSDGYVFRSMDGKPGIPADITDGMVLMGISRRIDYEGK